MSTFVSSVVSSVIVFDEGVGQEFEGAGEEEDEEVEVEEVEGEDEDDGVVGGWWEEWEVEEWE